MAHAVDGEFCEYESWNVAKSNARGYEDSLLVSNLVAQLATEAPWNLVTSDGNDLDTRSIELLAALNTVIENSHTKIRVADVGGGNGYAAYLAKRFIRRVFFEWTIFETPAIAEAYQPFEEEAGISWRDTNLKTEDRFHLGLLSSVLQYLEDPYTELRRIARQCDFLVITRVPLVSFVDTDLAMVQHPKGGTYGKSQASWPCWFFSKSKFVSNIESLGQVIYRWTTETETFAYRGETLPLQGIVISTATPGIPS